MARIVLGVGTRTSTDYVLSQLNWTSIENRWKMQRCKLVYGAINGQAPKYLTNLFDKANSIHGYRTRAAITDGLLIPKARTNSGKQAFSHVGAVEWNRLPHDVRQAPSKHTFSARFWKVTRN